MNFDRYDEPLEKLYWYCECQDCGWESTMVDNRDDLLYVECLDCGSENIRDEKTYA